MGNAPYELSELEPTLGLEREDPARILEAARAKAGQIREAARQEGFSAGYAAGLQAAEQDLGTALAALQEAASGISTLRATREEQLLEEATELALALAEKVVLGALTVQPERVVDVVRGVLRQTEERRGLKVFVNPEDLAVVEAARQRLEGEVGGLELLEIQGERRVPRGGAVVRTGEGELEATLRTSLARARELVEAELKGDA